MAETAELDTTTEAPSVNGHDEEWLEFDDDSALLKHILELTEPEELVPIPEWKTKILCRALDPKARIQLEKISYIKGVGTDYRPHFDFIVMEGCFNPKTGRKFFTDASRVKVMSKRDGGLPVVRLALTILRLSEANGEKIRKN